MSPQVLVDVDHCTSVITFIWTPVTELEGTAMDIMMVSHLLRAQPLLHEAMDQEETFGPVVGIQKVGEQVLFEVKTATHSSAMTRRCPLTTRHWVL